MFHCIIWLPDSTYIDMASFGKPMHLTTGFPRAIGKFHTGWSRTWVWPHAKSKPGMRWTSLTTYVRSQGKSGGERESENPNKNYVHFLGEEMRDTNVLLQRNNVDDWSAIKLVGTEFANLNYLHLKNWASIATGEPGSVYRCQIERPTAWKRHIL